MERKMTNLSIQNRKKAKPKKTMKKRLSMEMEMKMKTQKRQKEFWMKGSKRMESSESIFNNLYLKSLNFNES